MFLLNKIKFCHQSVTTYLHCKDSAVNMKVGKYRMNMISLREIEDYKLATAKFNFIFNFELLVTLTVNYCRHYQILTV